MKDRIEKKTLWMYAYPEFEGEALACGKLLYG